MPRDCPALYRPGPDLGPLMQAEDQVRAWIGQALAAGAGGAAPAPVLGAYRVLSSCGPAEQAGLPQVPRT